VLNYSRSINEYENYLFVNAYVVGCLFTYTYSYVLKALVGSNTELIIVNVLPSREETMSQIKCGTTGHGLVGNISSRWMVGLDDLGGLYQPWPFYGSTMLLPLAVYQHWKQSTSAAPVFSLPGSGLSFCSSHGEMLCFPLSFS